MITLILPYYRAPAMLRTQLDEIAEYPEGIKVIVVDDGSPEPASEVFESYDTASLYRINEDIAWNREQARNLGAYVADTDWIIQADIDHVLPVECVESLLSLEMDKSKWYRFPRYRVGKADETRNKDALPRDQEFGKIRPHVDSYLITRSMFLSSPYDERYSGCLGGGTPFTARMSRLYGEPALLPDDVHVHVYTRSKVKDASISTLSRDTSEYTRRRKLYGESGPSKMLLHPWHRVL